MLQHSLHGGVHCDKILRQGRFADAKHSEEWRRDFLLAATMGLAPAESKEGAKPFKDNYVTANGVRLHYVSAGKGPLILFLHGFPEFLV